MKLNDLREQRALKLAEARALVEKAEAEKRQMTEGERTTFEKLKGEIQIIEGDESRAQFLADAERRAVGEPLTKSEAELESRVSLLRVLQAGMEGRSLTGAELEYAREAELRTGRKAEGVFVPMRLLEGRATTDTTAAPELVGTDHRADQYIGALRAKLLARRLGVRVLSGLRGNVSIPKHGSGTSMGWVAEGGALAESGMGFDGVSLAPKHAGGYATLSRQLLLQSDPSIEALVRDDLSFVMAKAIDSALIKGGGANEPKGVLSASAIQTGSLATPSWQAILEMKGKLESADIDPSSASWLMAPAAAETLRGTLKSASAGAGYLLEGGRMAELAAHVTTQVPVKSGSPDTNYVILGDWSQAILGIWSEADILVNPFAESAYKVGAVHIRIMSTVDIALRHEKAFVVASDLA